MRNQTKGADQERLNREYRSIKTSFRMFFEGIDGYDPMVDIPITRFGITNLEFSEFEGRTKFTVTLERPGILIGKAGRVINELEAYLTRHHGREVKILIKESKLWR